MKSLVVLCSEVIAKRFIEFSRMTERLPTIPHFQEIVSSVSECGAMTREALSMISNSRAHSDSLRELRICECEGRLRGQGPRDGDISTAICRLRSLTSLILFGSSNISRPCIASKSLLSLDLLEVPTAARKKSAAPFNPDIVCPGLVSVRMRMLSPTLIYRQIRSLSERSPLLRVLDISDHVNFRFTSFDARFPNVEEVILDSTKVSDSGIVCMVGCCPRIQRLSIRSCPDVRSPEVFSSKTLHFIDARETPVDGHWIERIRRENPTIELTI